MNKTIFSLIFLATLVSNALAQQPKNAEAFINDLAKLLGYPTSGIKIAGISTNPPPPKFPESTREQLTDGTSTRNLMKVEKSKITGEVTKTSGATAVKETIVLSLDNDGKAAFASWVVVRTEKLEGGKTLTISQKKKADGTNDGPEERSQSGVEPVQSPNAVVYTELAAGFAWSKATRVSYFTTALRDGSGNPVMRDGKQVYRVDATDQQQTVSTQLSGQIRLALGTGRRDADLPDGRLIPVHRWGFTFGAGFGQATSGTLSLSPFAGLSFFLGDNDTAVLTAGWAWVPQERLKGLKEGAETFSDQLSTYTSYGPPTFFIGLSYRIGGSSKVVGTDKSAKASETGSR